MVVLMLAALLGVSGCNAISFFPREPAEKAADQVLDDILPGNGTAGNGAPVDAAKPTVPSVPSGAKQP